MTLDRGATFGPFVITDALGAGGMGEVYRATDTNLHREVAIKILPHAFVDDPDRAARFQREAEILASLNHPNIAHVHGLERGNGAAALVMELVEGPTLAEHIARGPLPQELALKIAKQISEALESAHARGIIHRDLKPANVKLATDGRVKVLDFGLAKVVAQSAAPPTGAPGKAGLSTEPGAVFGTPAYMSPEQLRGGAVDKRTDVWAFGCVLFELLTGETAFSGPTKSDVCANVLNSEPNWNLLPARTPPAVRRLLRRCLRKDVEQRMRDIGDARLDLEESGEEQPAAAPPRQSRIGPAVAAALGVAIVAGIAILASSGRFGERTAEQAEFRFELSTPLTAVPEQFAVSPDGSRVVSVGTTANGLSKLWLKEIGSSSERELAGTEGAEWPFWSPDSRSVAFHAQGKLKKYDLTTQNVQVLIDGFAVQLFLGGAWNADGVLLLTPSFTDSIYVQRFGPEGPLPEERVTTVDRARETGHLFPHFLPDGKHFLYYVNGDRSVSGTYLRSLDGSVAKRLLSSDSTAVYSEPGRLLFMRGTTLYAQPFDLESLALSGDAFVVTDAPVVNSLGSGGMSASSEGTIVYRTGIPARRREFVWRDEQGRELERVGGPLDGAPSSPELTSKEDGIVFHRSLDAVNLDVWLIQFSGSAPTRITLDDGNEWNPIVSPVDDTLVYSNFVLNNPAPTQLFSKPLSSNAVRGQPLLETRVNKRPMAYSADGRTILYATLPDFSSLERGAIPRRLSWDIWALTIGSRQSVPVASTEANEWNAQFSPDQSWVAFESDESGRVEVYLQSYPDGKVKRTVSSRGGVQPRWFADGADQYLYFVDPDSVLYRTRLIEGAEPALVSFGPPQRLFQANIGNVTAQNYNTTKQQYLVDRRGRILTNEPLKSSDPLRVIRHWSGQPAPK